MHARRQRQYIGPMMDGGRDKRYLSLQKPSHETFHLASLVEREACISVMRSGYLIHPGVRLEECRHRWTRPMLEASVVETDM